MTAEEIRRAAGLMGHTAFKDPHETCPVCGMSFDDMMQMNRVPHCDPGRWLARAMTQTAH